MKTILISDYKRRQIYSVCLCIHGNWSSWIVLVDRGLRTPNINQLTTQHVDGDPYIIFGALFSE